MRVYYTNEGFALAERGRRIWAALIEVLDGESDD